MSTDSVRCLRCLRPQPYGPSAGWNLTAAWDWVCPGCQTPAEHAVEHAEVLAMLRHRKARAADELRRATEELETFEAAAR